MTSDRSSGDSALTDDTDRRSGDLQEAAQRLVEDHLNITRPSALRALRQLQELNVLDPAPDGPRRQLRWRATEVLEILTDEPDPADP